MDWMSGWLDGLDEWRADTTWYASALVIPSLLRDLSHWAENEILRQAQDDRHDKRGADPFGKLRAGSSTSSG
jgi:hypothetical protein